MPSRTDAAGEVARLRWGVWWLVSVLIVGLPRSCVFCADVRKVDGVWWLASVLILRFPRSCVSVFVVLTSVRLRVRSCLCCCVDVRVVLCCFVLCSVNLLTSVRGLVVYRPIAHRS